MLVLSLFPGIGMLDRGFEAEGFCVVRGPDLIFGGDIRKFEPPPGKFLGVIGGPPCQDFSGARRTKPTGSGVEMLDEYRRCVIAARPEWWLCENVSRVPDVAIDGYERQRFDINQAWFSGVSRPRHIQYGSRAGKLLHIERGRKCEAAESCAMARDGRSFRELCRLQGLPDDFELPGMTETGRKRAVGNGVPYLMARELARAVLRAYDKPHSGEQLCFNESFAERRRCECGCGREVGGELGRQRFYDATCRKRAQRARDKA